MIYIHTKHEFHKYINEKAYDCPSLPHTNTRTQTPLQLSADRGVTRREKVKPERHTTAEHQQLHIQHQQQQRYHQSNICETDQKYCS